MDPQALLGEAEPKPHGDIELQVGKPINEHITDVTQFGVEDKKAQQSVFVRQTTKRNMLSADSHSLQLALAIISMLAHLVNTATDWVLVWDFWPNYRGFAWGLITIHLITAATHIVFDYLNRGRIRYFFLDLFQVRIVQEFFVYFKEYNKHKGKPWADKHFRSSNSFESFLGALPALIIQTAVLLKEENVSSIQYVSITLTILIAFQDLLHKFKYVSLSATSYFWMLMKALFNTGIRTVLSSLLLLSLGQYAIIWGVVSYAAGLVVYALTYRRSRSLQRDDPIRHLMVHLIFANLIAQDMMFCSFPFAPNHSIQDWWYGYLMSETKIQLENVAMAMALLIMYNVSSINAILFYAATFFACSVLITSYVALGFLHVAVNTQLFVRGIYSSGMIVKLFANTCSYTHQRLNDERAAKFAKDLAERAEKREAMAELRKMQDAQEDELRGRTSERKRTIERRKSMSRHGGYKGRKKSVAVGSPRTAKGRLSLSAKHSPRPKAESQSGRRRTGSDL